MFTINYSPQMCQIPLITSDNDNSSPTMPHFMVVVCIQLPIQA